MNKEIILQELESLIRTLDFIQEEQSFIKRKLSSLLDHFVMVDLVAWAEELHQEILNRETAVQLLKGDAINFRNQIRIKSSLNNIIESSKVSIFKKYKQQVGYIEAEFYKWKNAANEKFDTAVN